MPKAKGGEGVPASVQFGLKWDALRQLAKSEGHSSKTEAINWFLRNQGDKAVSAKTASEYLDRTMDGIANNAQSQKALLRGMMKVSEFRGEIGEFAVLPYDEWLQRIPPNILAVATAHRPIWTAPKVRFCESDVTGSELREWETKGVVDQRHMYESREAAWHWQSTRRFKGQSALSAVSANGTDLRL